MLIHCLWFLLTLSCNELFSHVILILACVLSLIWDYFWSAWVICTLVCGSIFTERFYICHRWVSQGFYLSRMNFHSVFSVWDSNTMWSVFGLCVHMWHRLRRGPARPDASLILFWPPWEVLPFLLHKGGGFYVEVYALTSYFMWAQGFSSDFHGGFYDSSPLLFGCANKSATPRTLLPSFMCYEFFCGILVTGNVSFCHLNITFFSIVVYPDLCFLKGKKILA